MKTSHLHDYLAVTCSSACVLSFGMPLNHNSYKYKQSHGHVPRLHQHFNSVSGGSLIHATHVKLE